MFFYFSQFLSFLAMPLTLVLLLLVIAAIFLGVYLRQRRALTAPAAMSDDERERAKQLLKG
jgi:cytochrome c-type biogenesis protein CcmH/NrfF